MGEIDVRLAEAMEVVDALPWLPRSRAELRTAAAIRNPALDHNRQIGTLGVKPDQLRLLQRDLLEKTGDDQPFGHS